MIEPWVFVEETLESPLDCKEFKPVNPKINQFWISIGRTDAEAEALIHWHLVWRANLLEKTLMPGKIEGRRRRVDREWDGWMASSNEFEGHKFEQTPGDSEGQGSLASADHGVTKTRTQLSDWTTTNQEWLQLHASSLPVSLPPSLPPLRFHIHGTITEWICREILKSSQVPWGLVRIPFNDIH